MLTETRIRQLLEALTAELAAESVRGEIYLAGGAVMCLVFHAREATKDIAALLVPAAELRRAAQRVGEREGLEPGWLNDAVKGFFSASGRFDVYQEFSHLRVFAPHPEYLPAMKCFAMRLGEEFQDRNDVAVLAEALGLRHASAWVIEPLGSGHNRADFSCGNAPLDRYLKEQAGQDLRRGGAMPFVLVSERGGTSVLGYYTLSSYGVDIGDLPADPLIPATLLGRLAVDRRHQGQDVGEFLLMDALHRALVKSAEIAAAAVVVESIDAGAAKFYQHFGFAFPSIAHRLFLPMKAVAGLFR